LTAEAAVAAAAALVQLVCGSPETIDPLRVKHNRGYSDHRSIDLSVCLSVRIYFCPSVHYTHYFI
jgi:hypothetical protein